MATNHSVVFLMESCQDMAESLRKILSDQELKYINCEDPKFTRFGNNEVNVVPQNSVRNKNVFILCSGSNFHADVNSHLMAALELVRACRDASAYEITVICTYLPYCRSDKKDQGRASINAKLVCDMFKTAGAKRMISFDLHAAQIQGFFDGPYDNLYAIGPLSDKLASTYLIDRSNAIFISPDVGGEKRVTAWARSFGVNCTFLTKHRDHNAVSSISHHELVHQFDLKGKNCFIIDDIADTMGTIVSAAQILKEKGAEKVVAVVTHGVFSGSAFDNLAKPYVDEVYCTNSLPQSENVKRSDKIKVVDLAQLVHDVMFKCVTGDSVSSLFV